MARRRKSNQNHQGVHLKLPSGPLVSVISKHELRISVAFGNSQWLGTAVPVTGDTASPLSTATQLTLSSDS